MLRASRALPCLVAAVLLVPAAGARAADNQQPQPSNGSLKLKPCPDSAPGVLCGDINAPMDYDKPKGEQISLHVAVSPAEDQKHKVGALFLNFGGPGGLMSEYIEAFGTELFVPDNLNQRFDIVGMDPRGVGETTPAVDCKANQATTGIYSEPFQTPFNVNPNQLIAKDERYISKCQQNNGDILSHLSTANVARDMDLVRQAMGLSKLNYFGFSYGTFLGATYAALFPHNYRAMVLDGAIDANSYINTPMNDLSEQTAAFERALDRFFQACAGNQTACSGFGGSDPMDAYDQLVDNANASPIPANGYAPDPRPVNGDDINAMSSSMLYNKADWGTLGQYLAEASAGDATDIRGFVDEDFYGRDPDTGKFDPSLDRYFTIGAGEQNYTKNLQTYFDAGDHAWGQFDHYYFNNGYVELNYGLWPDHDKDAFDGPFRLPNSAQTPLVVTNTYDPATPNHGAQRLVSELGNARLLTMRGDGHTAYQLGSPDCIDPAIENYLFTLALPPVGTQCRQETPFAAPSAAAAEPQALSVSGAPQIRALVAPDAVLHQRPHTRG